MGLLGWQVVFGRLAAALTSASPSCAPVCVLASWALLLLRGFTALRSGRCSSHRLCPSSTSRLRHGAAARRPSSKSSLLGGGLDPPLLRQSTGATRTGQTIARDLTLLGNWNPLFLCGAFGGNRGVRPVPPEKGVFPLDHLHECDLEKKNYLACLKSTGSQSEKCRQFSKKYLECRMERNLMAKQDMSELGFRNVDEVDTNPDKNRKLESPPDEQKEKK
ncbi:hypothetical protein U9M48_045002 [Paspalum notatum var. saurae]|uniref:CHCH domain-containing protein n=1 Tax=Paspalum notatum var. saurae TaxID=547442 RepID=A0AAQ3XIW1_PASNO